MEFILWTISACGVLYESFKIVKSFEHISSGITEIDEVQSDRTSDSKKECCCINYLSLCCFG